MSNKKILRTINDYNLLMSLGVRVDSSKSLKKDLIKSGFETVELADSDGVSQWEQVIKKTGTQNLCH